MAKQSGRNFVLAIEDATTAGDFNVVANMRTTSMTINNEPVDVTTKSDEDGSGKLQRQLLERGGIQSMSISADGVFESVESIQELRNNAFNNTHTNYQIDENFSGGQVFEGSFMVASFERSGGHDNEYTYSITLESAGDIAVTDS